MKPFSEVQRLATELNDLPEAQRLQCLQEIFCYLSGYTRATLRNKNIDTCDHDPAIVTSLLEIADCIDREVY